MRPFCILCAVFAISTEASAQTRAGFATRFGSPRSEVFLLPDNVKLTATYNASDLVCALRIETPEHSERAAPNLTDKLYWLDARQITRLLEELVPVSSRRGPVTHESMGLRVGEQILIESDETVQITRIQRSRPLLITPEMPVADRLVKVLWKRPECQPH